MYIPPLPLSWLVHSVTYQVPGVDNGWGSTTGDIDVQIKRVRFDNSVQFSRDSTQNSESANAVVFVCTTHSSNVPERFVSGATIIFNGDEYTIKKIVICYYPDSPKIHHYELELV